MLHNCRVFLDHAPRRQNRRTIYLMHLYRSDSTDGQIALIVNMIVRSLSQLKGLESRRFSPAVYDKRKNELTARIATLITQITGFDHVGAREIAESVRKDCDAGRAAYVAAGARRFFNFPLNWQIRNGEVVAGTAATVRRPAYRPSRLYRRSPAQ